LDFLTEVDIMPPTMSKTPSTTIRSRKKSLRKRTATTGRTKPKKVSAPVIANYAAALRYLNDRMDLERSRVSRLRKVEFKLDRMKALMRALGNPQNDLRIVHVAGTKGKGSVCEMVSSCLGACGYTVGLYTSPHLVEMRERIRVGGALIPTGVFAKAMQTCADAAATIERRHGKPTYFELLTALALKHFADQAVDVAVFECGLGGRLDATNIIHPIVTAITSISFDHIDVLGDTLDQIAREKAGIFKQGVPAVTIKQEAGVVEAMRDVAERVGCELEVVGKEIEFSYRFEATPKIGPHTCVCLNTERSSFDHFNVPLKGEHQAPNCGLALAILDKLRSLGIDTPENKVIVGLEKTSLAGRMEMALHDPRVMLDGAHNASSIKALIRAIGAHVPYDSMAVVFGCSEDKDVDGMLKYIALGADKVIFTRAKGNPRALDPHDLQERFGELSGKMSQVEATLPEALTTAARAVGRDDLICVTGSFYLVGEAKKHLAQRVARSAAR